MSADHDPPPLTQAHAWVRASPASLPEARGTLCAVLASLTLPRRYYGLSAGHVLGGHSTAAEGEATVLEQAWPPLQLQGRLARWSPRFHSHQASGPIDAGLMELSAQAVEDLADDIEWPAGAAAAQVGDPVRLLARHHHVQGTVRQLNQQTTVTGTFAGQYELTGISLCEFGSPPQPGDSGAPIWNEARCLVGLYVGLRHDGMAVMVPIERVLAWAGCELLLAAEDRWPLLPSAMAAAPAASPVSATISAAVPARVDPVNVGEVDVLARTLWGEARGEGTEGLRAVGHVVLNRVAGPRWWGDSVESVCRKPWQFSCWNERDPNRAQLLAVDLRNPHFAIAMRVAQALLESPGPDPTGGATHYHALGVRPSWLPGARMTVQIGRHRFYRDVP